MKELVIPHDIDIEIIGNDYTKLQLIKSKDASTTIKGWLTNNQPFINDLFDKKRIILFKGFKELGSRNEFSEIVSLLSEGGPLNYSEPSTPRTQLAQNIYSSTEYPRDQEIAQHNEHSYSANWAKKIFFYCEKPASTGGHTPISDSSAVYDLIPPAIIANFKNKGGIMYVRNFTSEMDIRWQDFFVTSDRKEVEEYCKKRNMSFEWRGNNNLRVSYTAQVALKDNLFNKDIWFNQAHLFHYSNLKPEIYSYLIELYGIENLPRNTYFKDNSEIEIASLNEIRSAYNKAMFKFNWEKGDLLFMDNVRYGHGRTSYTGERSVIVAMSEEDAITNY